MKNKKIILLLVLLTTLTTFNACNLGHSLSEEQAKKAGDYMINLENQEYQRTGVKNGITFIEWKGFVQLNETTAELRGVVKFQAWTNSEMLGKFCFTKTNNGEWVLDNYYFTNGNNTWSKNDILYKIPN